MARRSNEGTYHLLNMGRTKFGECIVAQIAGKTILIDCGHPGGYKDNDDRPSIPNQLGIILGQESPFHFDLIVVTHCHLDHIGCLPKLVLDRTITCDQALVADERLGFGLDVNGRADSRLDGASAQTRAVIAALTEEDHSSLRGVELEAFLADAVAFGPPGERVLLPGDMQFAIPQIRGFEEDLGELKQAVAEDGPYALVKLPHHSSNNGTNEELLATYGWPELLAHSGGYNIQRTPIPIR